MTYIRLRLEVALKLNTFHENEPHFVAGQLINSRKSLIHIEPSSEIDLSSYLFSLSLHHGRDGFLARVLAGLPLQLKCRQ